MATVFVLTQPESAPIPAVRPEARSAAPAIASETPQKVAAIERKESVLPPAGADRGHPEPTDRRDTKSRAGLEDADLIDVGISPERSQQILDRVRATAPERDSLKQSISAMKRGRERAALLQALRELDAEDAEIFGEDNARVRYAVGENNAVYVDRLLRNSQGLAGGLLPGDQVVSYGGKEIYSADQLHLLARAAKGTAKVPVILRRGDVEVETTMRGGGLGMFLEEVSELPD